MRERIVIVAPAAAHRLRLEDFLLWHFRSLSKMYLRDTVNAERCEVNGRWENVGYRLRERDLIEIDVDTTRETAMTPEAMDLDIIFEDADILAVNKPAGLLVHPSHRENSGTLLNGIVHYLNRDRGDELPPLRPGLPHRLDKDTSGVIVIGKTPFANRDLSRSFMKKLVEKSYAALVKGIVAEDAGVIEAPIGRCAEEKFWGVQSDGKPSISQFEVSARGRDATLLKLVPVTGRTNQLRIHCEYLGHPILGDERRGGGTEDRLYLHARELRFPHPRTRETVILTAPTPDEFAQRLWKADAATGS